MPCNSDYLSATRAEIALSRVACLLDEIDGKKIIDPSHWAGYHPRVYSRISLPGPDADAMVAQLCAHLSESDVSKYSLEMQTWWRDHVVADKARLEHESRDVGEKEEREAALAKLSAREKGLLGL